MTSNDADDTADTGDAGHTGRLDDAAEAEELSTEDGAAAAGEYDPAQGSPGTGHPVGEDFPNEAVSYDDPDERPRSQGAGAE